jgi:undecaprenyl-diphosphatase
MIEYIILAILQGLFEWLPISSSGQVMLSSINFFGLSPEEAFSLAIWLHLGTTIAVIIKLRHEYIEISKACLPMFFGEPEELIKKRRNWVIIATIGTGVTALPLYFILKTLLNNVYTAAQGDVFTLIIAGLLLITGVVLLKTKKTFGKYSIDDKSFKHITKDSFKAGLAQGFSILPGISRSGTTISVILLENYKQESALKLSFLMSVPVALASIGVDIIFGGGSVFGFIDPLTIILIVVISFLIGFLSMEALLRIAKKIDFGYFCIIYGITAFFITIPFLILS